MKKIIILFFLTMPCVSFVTMGQSIQNSVIGSTGTSATAGSVMIDYTIGEIVIETFTAGGQTLTQGFHQSTLHMVAIENAGYFPEISIYPNPSSDLVNIDIPSSYNMMDINLYDVNGKLIRNFSDAQGKITFDVGTLAGGTYYLQMINTTANKIKTFKLIKSY